MLDDFVGNLRVTARGTTEEAIERTADLVRYGDRGQLFILLRAVRRLPDGCLRRKALMNGCMTSTRPAKTPCELR